MLSSQANRPGPRTTATVPSNIRSAGCLGNHRPRSSHICRKDRDLERCAPRATGSRWYRGYRCQKCPFGCDVAAIIQSEPVLLRTLQHLRIRLPGEPSLEKERRQRSALAKPSRSPRALRSFGALRYTSAVTAWVRAVWTGMMRPILVSPRKAGVRPGLAPP